MSTERILMSNPDVGELEEEYVLSALRSGWIAPLGPDVDAFEREMAERTGVDYAIALSSGTAALHLGLLALGVGKNDTVVTSTMTFAATANAITYTGASPFFVDCDPTTGNMDPALLEQALRDLEMAGNPAAAVVPVDLFGKSADYSAILTICQKVGIPVLADAAESLGATHNGAAAGSFGKAAAFSFNGNKIMTTSGGGMLMTSDSNVAHHARYLATQARQPVVHYEHTDVGYNYRMSNLLAALGRAQLSRLDSMIARRRVWRDRYREMVRPISGIELFGGEDAEDNCWLSSMVIDSEQAPVSAQSLRERMNQSNIETRPLWKPMHLQPVFADAPKLVNGSSERLFQRGLTLPSGSSMSEEQYARVENAFADIVGLS